MHRWSKSSISGSVLNGRMQLLLQVERNGCLGRLGVPFCGLWLIFDFPDLILCPS